MSSPAEPTAEECAANKLVYEDNERVGYAIWYPQMGGYSARAVVVFFKNLDDTNACLDVYVWHDGEWPFHNGEPPTPLHHCDAEQFIRFGRKVMRLQGVEEEP